MRTPGLPFSLLNRKVSQTIASTQYYANGTTGLDANTGLQHSNGTGGTLAVAAGVVTATLAGAVLPASIVGWHAWIDDCTSSDNNGSFVILSRPAANQITYANVRGVTEALPVAGRWAIASPKLTLQAIFNAVPDFIKHNTTVNLAGIFDEYGTPAINKSFVQYLLTYPSLIIDGGSAISIVADNAGAPWVSDIHSTSTIGLTTWGKAIDQYAGYMVEITSGPAAGQQALIISNTVTTITVQHFFTIDPGVGAGFRVVRPATTLSSTALSSYVSFSSNGRGYIYVQRLSFSGTQSCFGVYNLSYCIAFVTVVSSSAAGCYMQKSGSAGCTNYGQHPITFVLTLFSHGLSLLNASTFLSASTIKTLFVCHCYCYKLQVDASAYGSNAAFQCSRFRSMIIANSVNLGETFGYHNTDTASASYTSFQVDNPAGVGIKFINSQFRFNRGSVHDCLTHGIESINSQLTFIGVFAGTGNGGAGIYAHDVSDVQIKHGAPPTLTGGIGDISTDGVTPAGTWAEVDAAGVGVPAIVDIGECTVIKEVA
jgi:hypothetical protein